MLKSTKKILITGGLGYLGSHTTVVLQHLHFVQQPAVLPVTQNSHFTLTQMVQTTWLWQQNLELAGLDTKLHNAN